MKSGFLLLPLLALSAACGTSGATSASSLACAAKQCSSYSAVYKGRQVGTYGKDEFGTMESDIAKRVNAVRAKSGLPALRTVSFMVGAAQKHSADQAELQEMSHILYGKSVSDRLNDIKYQWQAAGENVAEGQQGAEEVMTDWMNSPGHRANILGEYTSFGVGVQRGKDGNLYFTQVFATPFNDQYD